MIPLPVTATVASDMFILTEQPLRRRCQLGPQSRPYTSPHSAVREWSHQEFSLHHIGQNQVTPGELLKKRKRWPGGFSADTADPWTEESTTYRRKNIIVIIYK